MMRISCGTKIVIKKVTRDGQIFVMIRFKDTDPNADFKMEWAIPNMLVFVLFYTNRSYLPKGQN